MAELRRKIRVRMHDTDAAGILFFSNQFLFMHDAYEELLQEIGFPMQRLIGPESFFVPIVHAEAQFSKQLSQGDELTISVSIERIGNTSYALAYQLFTDENELAGTGKTVHVTIDRDTKEKIPLPPKFRNKLESFQTRE
jgi:1,4-dihydroxy-2-naphthoyl-CoA hydrolase